MNHRQISKAAAPRYITMISFSFISLLLFAHGDHEPQLKPPRLGTSQSFLSVSFHFSSSHTLVTFKGYQVVVLAEVVFNLIM
jgi:hypothetical protein